MTPSPCTAQTTRTGDSVAQQPGGVHCRARQETSAFIRSILPVWCQQRVWTQFVLVPGGAVRWRQLAVGYFRSWLSSFLTHVHKRITHVGEPSRRSRRVPAASSSTQLAALLPSWTVVAASAPPRPRQALAVRSSALPVACALPRAAWPSVPTAPGDHSLALTHHDCRCEQTVFAARSCGPTEKRLRLECRIGRCLVAGRLALAGHSWPLVALWSDELAYPGVNGDAPREAGTTGSQYALGVPDRTTQPHRLTCAWTVSKAG